MGSLHYTHVDVNLMSKFMKYWPELSIQAVLNLCKISHHAGKAMGLTNNPEDF